jgi:hypothetical protein
VTHYHAGASTGDQIGTESLNGLPIHFQRDCPIAVLQIDRNTVKLFYRLCTHQDSSVRFRQDL